MFRIYDGRNHFYQWDIDRKLIIKDNSITQVHFCNKTSDYALVCEVRDEDNLRVVDVPNILLQEDWSIDVYAYDKHYTKFDECFEVVKRSKPDSYVYVETEILNYQTLLNRMDEVDANIASAVDAYLEENPVEVDLSGLATEEYVTDAIAAIEIPEADLTGYATEKYVDEAVAAIPEVDLSEYAKKSEIPSTSGFASESYVNNKIKSGLNDYYTKFQSDERYANKTEIPSTEGFATQKYVDNKVGLIQIPSLDGLATEEYVDDAIRKVPTVSLSGYAKESYVDDAIKAIPKTDLSSYATKQYVGEQIAAIPEVDLKDYAKKSDIPSTKGLATEDYVQQKIAEAELGGGEVDLSNYYTKTQVDNKIAAIPQPDLNEYAKKSEIPDTSGLATKKEVEDAIAAIEIPSTTGLASEQYVTEAIAAIEIPDVSNFTTMSAVEAKGYQTANEVTAAINSALGAIGVAEEGAY